MLVIKLKNMETVISFFKAVKSLGFSAVSCIIKGLIAGFLISLVLTLLLFYWGETVFGLKYIIGFIFFVAVGVLLSVYRILKEELNLLNGTVDNVAKGVTDKADALLGSSQEVMNPEAQFEKAKGYILEKCPAVTPLIEKVNYEHVQMLAAKSSKISSVSKLMNDNIEKVNGAPSLIKSSIDSIKLVWTLPVGVFMKKVMVIVVSANVLVLIVRLIMQ